MDGKQINKGDKVQDKYGNWYTARRGKLRAHEAKMTHSDSLSELENGGNFAPLAPYDHPDCKTELEYVSSPFFSDVQWVKYFCPTCNQYIYTVEGHPHWWNFTRPVEVA